MGKDVRELIERLMRDVLRMDCILAASINRWQPQVSISQRLTFTTNISNCQFIKHSHLCLYLFLQLPITIYLPIPPSLAQCKLIITMLSQSVHLPLRPKSAHPFPTSRPRQHRLDDNQSLNSIRNHIHRVFSQENKSMKQVKELTSHLTAACGARIDRMCVQYSICANPKRMRVLSDDVDVEFIAKKYVRAKSKEKKKEQARNELRRSIGATSKRYEPQAGGEFFKFDYSSLRKMQQRALKGNSNQQLKEHPYMQLYERSQDQALHHLSDRYCLPPKELTEHPILAEPEQWQRQTKQIKQIYTGVKQLRTSTMRNKERRRDNEQTESFYVT